MGGFARDAPRAQNGFIAVRNCFVRSEATTQFSKTANHFNPVAPGFEVAARFQLRAASRGFEAAPQAFVRLTGSHLVKPQAGRVFVTE